jgi:hypothetical protein
MEMRKTLHDSAPGRLRLPTAFWFLTAMVWGLVLTSRAGETGSSFNTPDAAVAALGQAVAAGTDKSLEMVFGPDLAQITNSDPARATEEIASFRTAFAQTNFLVRQSENRFVLVVGTNLWPFPFPLVQSAGQWRFDPQLGREELLNRRVGTNELFTLQVLRTYVQAQREYATTSHDDSQVLAYAQKLLSSPGKHDGLYWPPEGTSPLSPIGPDIAAAEEATGGTAPFHGYLFRVLTRQGSHADGGRYDYIINGRMISGFGLIAWPGIYGQSGVMTFLVNQQGRVFQKDLGPKTSKLAPAIKEYDPDSTWQLSPD